MPWNPLLLSMPLHSHVWGNLFFFLAEFAALSPPLQRSSWFAEPPRWQHDLEISLLIPFYPRFPSAQARKTGHDIFSRCFLFLSLPLFLWLFPLFSIFLIFSFLKKCIDLRERERETLIYCSICLCSHWLILVCALTWDWPCNLGIWGRCSNHLNYLARARLSNIFLSIWFSKHLQGAVHGAEC